MVTIRFTVIEEVGPAEPGFSWVWVGGIRIYSCYWSTNCRIEEFIEFLQRLERSARDSLHTLLKVGDFNLKSPEWGLSPREDYRGSLFAELATSLGLVVFNHGSQSTFVHNASESHLDITIVSHSISNIASGWRVREEECLSLHRFNSFSLDVRHQREAEDGPTNFGRAVKNFSAQKLQEALVSTPYIDPMDPTNPA